MLDIFANEFKSLNIVYTSFLNFMVGCHDVFPVQRQSNLFGKIAVNITTTICIHGPIYRAGALCQTFLPMNFKV